MSPVHGNNEVTDAQMNIYLIIVRQAETKTALTMLRHSRQKCIAV
jgi:hypothetical protein